MIYTIILLTNSRINWSIKRRNCYYFFHLQVMILLKWRISASTLLCTCNEEQSIAHYLFSCKVCLPVKCNFDDVVKMGGRWCNWFSRIIGNSCIVAGCFARHEEKENFITRFYSSLSFKHLSLCLITRLLLQAIYYYYYSKYLIPLRALKYYFKT